MQKVTPKILCDSPFKGYPMPMKPTVALSFNQPTNWLMALSQLYGTTMTRKGWPPPRGDSGLLHLSSKRICEEKEKKSANKLGSPGCQQSLWGKYLDFCTGCTVCTLQQELQIFLAGLLNPNNYRLCYFTQLIIMIIRQEVCSISPFEITGKFFTLLF